VLTPRSRLPHPLLVQRWTNCMAPRKATWTDFSAYRINLRVLYYRHRGLLVLRTCAVNFIGCQLRQQIVFELATVTYKAWLSGLPAYGPTYSVKFTITIRLELYVQLQLFSYSSNQPGSHYRPIICSESVLCNCSYNLELSWCPHPFS